MRLAILAIVAVAMFAPGANAATYTLTTNATQEAQITAARAVYNGALPACGAPTSDCTKDANYQAANGNYLIFVLTSAFQSYQAAAAKANEAGLLSACVAAGGLGGLTAAQCSAIQAATQ